MEGYQVSFYTEQNRHHRGLPLADWLVELGKETGVKGATVLAAAESYGRDGKIHSVHFFDLAEQPVTVQMIGEVQVIDALIRKIRDEAVDVFYVKIPVEYGTTQSAGSK